MISPYSSRSGTCPTDEDWEQEPERSGFHAVTCPRCWTLRRVARSRDGRVLVLLGAVQNLERGRLSLGTGPRSRGGRAMLGSVESREATDVKKRNAGSEKRWAGTRDRAMDAFRRIVSEGIQEGLAFAVVGAVRRHIWLTKGWALKDTTFGEPQGKGVWLICPKGHEYWGRSLSGAEHRLSEDKEPCPSCEKGRGLMVLS